MREAFAKLSFREQTLLEKRSAICMTCGRVVPLNERAAPGGYRYQADNDGEWGEFTLDLATGELKINVLAELDTTKTHRFAKKAARYSRAHAGEKLPKRMLVAFE